jgi:hypothetical protein
MFDKHAYLPFTIYLPYHAIDNRAAFAYLPFIPIYFYDAYFYYTSVLSTLIWSAYFTEQTCTMPISAYVILWTDISATITICLFHAHFHQHTSPLVF